MTSKSEVCMLLWAHGNIWGGYLKRSHLGLNVGCLLAQEREQLLFQFDCTALCIVLVKRLKTSKGCNLEADGYTPMYSKSYSRLTWPCAQTHTSHVHPPSHKSYMTTHKRDNRQKGLFHFCIFQTVTLSVWGMHVGENTCIMSVRTRPLQTCWHTFVNTGRLCGMEHT